MLLILDIKPTLYRHIAHIAMDQLPRDWLKEKLQLLTLNPTITMLPLDLEGLMGRMGHHLP